MRADRSTRAIMTTRIPEPDEPQRPEEALRESHERFRLLFEGANDAIFGADAETGILTECNRAAEELMGRPRAEMIGQHHMMLHPPEEAERYRELFRAHASSQSKEPFELEIVRQDGRRVPVSISPATITIGGRQILQGIFRDISGQREDEKALRLFRTLVDQFDDALQVIDAETGRILDVNESACAMLGCSREELLALRLQDIDPAAEAFWPTLEMIRAHGTFRDEREHRRKDGSTFPVEVHAKWVQLDRDYIVAVSRDITRRKLAEAALRESEARFRRLLEANVIGVLFWDVHGNISEANDLFLRMIGYTREDLHAGEVNWRKITPPEYRDLDDRILASLAATGVCNPVEKEYIRKDGSRVSILLGGALFEGRQDAGIGIVLDITAHKQAESALRALSHRLLRAEEEERRRIAKELHDSTAQDLVAVMMNLGQVQEALGESDATVGPLLADTLAILENTTNELRTLAYVMHPPRLDDTGLAGALTEYAAGFGRRADIRVRLDLPPGLGRLPDEIELALFRVVQESLTNVLRHSESDTATIRLAKTAGGVVLEIIDEGRGLPPATASQSPGTFGVGIAGMRERMQCLGGSLAVESSPAGTTVRATLPLLPTAS
jgi:PAS domain S-box-containing protein